MVDYFASFLIVMFPMVVGVGFTLTVISVIRRVFTPSFEEWLADLIETGAYLDGVDYTGLTDDQIVQVRSAIRDREAYISSLLREQFRNNSPW